MPRLSKEFKQTIKEIPVEELQKLVIHFASKNAEIYDFINLQYVEGENAEEELFEETKEKISDEMLFPGERGIVQKNLAKAITKSVGYINYFVKVTKNKNREADLLRGLLHNVFENYADELGTCWTTFDSKLAVTTNRLLNLVTKKLHEDYRIEYRDDLNRFLNILHSRSNYLDYVYKMPKSLE
ncbi:MAG: hypothetical protein ACP5D9_13325 [Mariniphaga sp.]